MGDDFCLPFCSLKEFFSHCAWLAYTVSDRAYIIERKVAAMKIVILRSPALLAPILRRMFGIRKEKKKR